MKTARNPNCGKIPDIKGYKDLGWQNGWQSVPIDKNGNVTTDRNKAKYFDYLEKDYPEYGKCRRLGHELREFDNSLHLNRGTDNVVICDECKIYWHYDCSD